MGELTSADGQHPPIDAAHTPPRAHARHLPEPEPFLEVTSPLQGSSQELLLQQSARLLELRMEDVQQPRSPQPQARERVPGSNRRLPNRQAAPATLQPPEAPATSALRAATPRKPALPSARKSALPSAALGRQAPQHGLGGFGERRLTSSNRAPSPRRQGEPSALLSTTHKTSPICKCTHVGSSARRLTLRNTNSYQTYTKSISRGY